MIRKLIGKTLLFVFLFSLMTTLKGGEKSVYNFSWLDPDKEVYVLQNRKFRKALRAHGNLGFGKTVSGSFVDSTAIQGRGGFFFTEDWGFEVIYSKNSGSENVTAKSVRNDGGAGSVPFRRIVKSYFGGMLLWSPFYAKVNTFNKIIYVDWILGLGYANVNEENNREELNRVIPFQVVSETHGSLMWNMGLKFYITKVFHLRADITVSHYQAQKAVSNAVATENTWYSNYDLVFSSGINF